MDARQYQQLSTRDTVWCSFSNSYRKCRIVAIERPQHLIVEALGKDGRDGQPLLRRARYRSVDTTKRQKTQAEQAAYCKQIKAERLAAS